MAIEKVKPPKHGSDGKLYHYRVRFRPNAGRKGLVRYFEKLKGPTGAEAFQEQRNVEKRNSKLGLHSIEDWKKFTARQIVFSYIGHNPIDEDELPDDERELRKHLKERRAVAKNVFPVLLFFALRPVAGLSLYDFDSRVAKQYIEDRRNEDRKVHGSTSEPQKISPTSVAWEVAKLSKAWQWAIQNFEELRDLKNPWEKAIPKDMPRVISRDRELVGDELERLYKDCAGCLGMNRFYLPIGICLAVETGMRRQEITGLDWEDIDFKRRRITIKKDKTTKRTGKKDVEIVMSLYVRDLLTNVARALESPGDWEEILPTDSVVVNLKGPIFLSQKTGERLSEEAFSEAFDKVVERAKIEDLHLHDLRQTANTMFYRAGLDPEERQVMKRETDKTVDKKFYSGGISREILLERIQDKLDRYALGGLTVDEHREKFNDVMSRIWKRGFEMGLSPEETIKHAEPILNVYRTEMVEKVISHRKKLRAVES